MKALILTFFIGFTTSANENDDNDDNQKCDNTCRDHSHDYDDICTAHLLQKANALDFDFTRPPST